MKLTGEQQKQITENILTGLKLEYERKLKELEPSNEIGIIVNVYNNIETLKKSIILLNGFKQGDIEIEEKEI